MKVLTGAAFHISAIAVRGMARAASCRRASSTRSSAGSSDRVIGDFQLAAMLADSQAKLRRLGAGAAGAPLRRQAVRRAGPGREHYAGFVRQDVFNFTEMVGRVAGPRRPGSRWRRLHKRIQGRTLLPRRSLPRLYEGTTQIRAGITGKHLMRQDAEHGRFQVFARQFRRAVKSSRRNVKRR